MMDDPYGRVTRDLAAVTAGFADYLDRLPERLTAAHACRVRALTEPEAARLGTPATSSYAVEPADARASTLLVGRTSPDGAAYVTLAFGLTACETVPDCLCDGCAEGSDGMVESVEDHLGAVLGGFTEFRRPYRRTGERLHRGPWMEHGVTWADGAWSSASAEVRGEPFERVWAPWPRRPQRTSVASRS